MCDKYYIFKQPGRVAAKRFVFLRILYCGNDLAKTSRMSNKTSMSMVVYSRWFSLLNINHTFRDLWLACFARCVDFM